LTGVKSRIRGFAHGHRDADTQTMSETGNGTTAAEGDDGTADIAPVDVQRLLTWYFDDVHPERHHITSPHQSPGTVT
jgi:hypothetical protein